MTLNHLLNSRLLAGFGTAALLGAVGLFASRPAHSVGGPVAVTVANAPLGVVETGGTPFTANVFISIPSGTSTGTDNGLPAGSQSFTVPAGKRLIVQTVSLYRFGTLTSGSGVQVFVNCQTNGLYSAYSVPPAIATGAVYSGSTASETFQADAGSAAVVNAFRTTTTGGENETVTVSGYLVNAS